MRRAVILLAMMGASLAAQPASIEGTVVDQTTGKPLDRIHIAFLKGSGRENTDEAYGAMSDSAGHFSVAGMPPGRYRVLAERTGFGHVADGAGVSLKEGQQLTDPKVTMVRASMVTGRVVDQYGDPVPQTNVQIIPPASAKLSAFVGVRQFVQSNSRGEFRILTGPGKYYLEAMPERSGTEGPPEVRSDGTADAIYGPTFYPSAATKDRASVVEVAAGHDVDGLEIHLTAQVSQRPLSVSGTVTGMPAFMGIIVLFMPPNGENSMAYTGPDGKFSISGLAPGTYDVIARSGSNKKVLMGRTRVTLDTSDVTNLEVSLSEPGELLGTLEMVGGQTPAGKRTVALQPAGMVPFFEHASAEVDADGSVRIAGVWPGKFRLTVNPLPDTAYVKTVELDGEAVTDGVIEVAGGRVPRVKITVGLDGAVVSGKVLDKDGEAPAVPLGIFLLADPKEIKGATSTELEDGKYSFKGVRPGKYRLFALDYALLPEDSDTAQREETMQKLFAAAEEIEVRAGDRITKDLHLTAKEAVDDKKQ